ncbi:UNVERIFIED_CONTAM: hypothetical protein NCL1_30350 [Trichonephila clavipes]
MTSNLYKFDRAEEECPRCEELKKCSLFNATLLFSNLVLLSTVMEKLKKSPKGKVVPEPYLTHLETLEHLRKEESFPKHFANLLDKQTNPLFFALDLALYANTKYFKKGKQTVKSTVILESLKEWCQLRDVSALMTQKQKFEALNKALQLPYVGVKFVCEICQLEKEKEHVKEVIDSLLLGQRYKEVRKLC